MNPQTKLNLFLCLLITSTVVFSPQLRADLNHDLLGFWQYDGFFYQNHRYPLPNPDLILIFSFYADGTSRLYWSRQGERGFCERRGAYTLSHQTLSQVVTWTNPDNDPSCSQDPDMQMGKSTENEIDITDEFLNLHMNLNGEPFLYILKRRPDQRETGYNLSPREI